MARRWTPPVGRGNFVGMPTRTGPQHRDLAADVWRRMFQFFMRTRPQRDHVLGELGLTPNDARTLSSLVAGDGRTMRSLADEWGCDASNATWIVDRMEERGLAERRSQPGDRRVKRVVLTAAGRRMWKRLLGQMWQLPPDLLALDRADLELLQKALRKLPAGD